MAFSAGSGKGVRSDINITPLVDVVLVLLIIFLVTMPVLMKDITIDVPKKADEEIPLDMIPSQITVALKADGRVLLNDEEILKSEITEKLRGKLETKKSERIVFVDFEDAVMYGDAVGVMDAVKGAVATPEGAPGDVTIALKMKEEKPAGAGAPPATP